MKIIYNQNKTKTQPWKFVNGPLDFVYGYFSFEMYYSTTSDIWLKYTIRGTLIIAQQMCSD